MECYLYIITHLFILILSLNVILFFYVHDTRMLFLIPTNVTDFVIITFIFLSVLTILAELDITEEVIETISKEFLTKAKTTVKSTT